MFLFLLACGNVSDKLVLAELDEAEAGSICVEAAEEAGGNCGTTFDLDACAADVLAIPDGCGATVEQWRDCRQAYDALPCEPPFELPEACAWSIDESCVLQSDD